MTFSLFASHSLLTLTQAESEPPESKCYERTWPIRWKLWWHFFKRGHDVRTSAWTLTCGFTLPWIHIDPFPYYALHVLVRTPYSGNNSVHLQSLDERSQAKDTKGTKGTKGAKGKGRERDASMQSYASRHGRYDILTLVFVCVMCQSPCFTCQCLSNRWEHLNKFWTDLSNIQQFGWVKTYKTFKTT